MKPPQAQQLRLLRGVIATCEHGARFNNITTTTTHTYNPRRSLIAGRPPSLVSAALPRLFPHQQHCFSTSPPAHKKSKARRHPAKSHDASHDNDDDHEPVAAPNRRSSTSPAASDNDNAAAPADVVVDPHDHSALQAGIAKALARLRDALARTRTAGRIGPEVVENLPVDVTVVSAAEGGGGPGKKKETVRGRVGEYAAVVPQGGRALQVYVSEQSYIKPVMAAILASPHSLVATAPDATNNPLLLRVPIPPPTAESRAHAAADAKRSLERAELEIRAVRAAAQKKFRKMELQKMSVVVAVRKDELWKAHEGMEKIVREGVEEAKRILEGALKGLER